MNDPPEHRTVRIGRAPVGPGRRLCVIAEAGVNHNGSLPRALAMVRAARRAGADLVKFQMFRADALAAEGCPTADYQRRSVRRSRQVDMLRGLELTPQAFAAIRRECTRVGVGFLATPFGLDDLTALMRLRPAAIKLASPDLIYRDLLVAAARTGRTVLVSTGAAALDELDRAMAWLDRPRPTPRVVLQCTSSYPTPADALNLAVMDAFRHRCGWPVGLSDHTADVTAGALAAAAGADVIEKHFTLDRSLSGPDHATSLEPDELAEYIRAARAARAARGTGEKGVLPCERDVRRVARRSWFAARDIPAGTRLTAAMLAARRPPTGVPVDRCIVGLTTRRRLRAGQLIPRTALSGRPRRF